MKPLGRFLSKATSILFAAPFLLSACENETTGITRVSLNKTTLTLGIYESETLTATVTPSDASNQTVVWSTNDEDIATVNASTGEVTGISNGVTVITAKAEDGGKATCNVTVVGVRVKSVSVDKPTITINIGKYDVIKAVITPEDATYQSVVWSSDKPNVASVHPETGDISALGEGEAVITATTTDGGMTAECIVTVTDIYAADAPKYNNVNGIVADCADPYILQYDGTYYIYGTGGSDGIRTYSSTDLVNWSAAKGATNGYALHKNNVWGTRNFWAPEVYRLNNKFYMFYTANERLSMATSDYPIGPFSTPAENQKAYHANIGEIDCHMFVDDDGTKYLYFVRFNADNHIEVAKLSDDMTTVDDSTITKCIEVSRSWELVHSRVAEGPFVLKHKGYYYLTYSANHYESQSYAVGYAYSKSPMGPWTKADDSPILIGDMSNISGTGHHSFFYSPSGALYIVYHSHKTPTVIQARKACIDLAMWDNSTTPARLVVKGPTVTPQPIR
jgi:GH43 family beta-xylosidase